MSDAFEQAKEAIKDKVDLVQLVGEYTPTQQKGRLFWACCPFHGEKTPSFAIYPDSQHYKCYGCGVAGDVFTFVGEREGMTFREAFEWLAERAGVMTQGVFGRRRDDGRREAEKSAAQVLGDVAVWCSEQLRTEEGARAREYLEGRGLDGAASTFQLGYLPLGAREAQPPLLAFAKARGLSFEILEQAGLLRKGRNGGWRSSLAGRVVFPIVDDRGRVVGFGGRVLPGDDRPRPDGFTPPKYLNSPESPFFNKRRVLYGFREAKQAGTRRIVVMEGYTDVLAAHLAGFTGAVATLGTALTRDHAKLLERFATEGVVLLFDGDEAGRRAADRAFRELVDADLDVRIALADEGVDPADLLSGGPDRDPERAALGQEALQMLIDDAPPALDVWFRLVRRRADLSQPVHRDRVAKDCAGILKSVESAVRREALLQEMSRHLQLNPGLLSEMLPQSLRTRAVAGGRGPAVGGRASGSGRRDGWKKKDAWKPGSWKDRQKGPSLEALVEDFLGPAVAPTPRPLPRRSAPVDPDRADEHGTGRQDEDGGAAGSPSAGEPSAGEPSAAEPSAAEPSAGERSTGGPTSAAGGGRTVPASPPDPAAEGRPVDDDDLWGGSEELLASGAAEHEAASGGDPEGSWVAPVSPETGSEASPLPGRRRHPAMAGGGQGVWEAEFALVACLAARPELLPRVGEVVFSTPPLAELFRRLADAVRQGHTSSPKLLRTLFTRCNESAPLTELLHRIAERAGSLKEPEAALGALLQGFDRWRAGLGSRELRERIQQARRNGDEDEAKRLTAEFLNLTRNRHGGARGNANEV